MKKILSNSKMREVLNLKPKDDGKARTAVFEKGKITELEDSDLSFLKTGGGGPFNWFVEKGHFVVVDSGSEDHPSEDESSKLDKTIKSLQEQKADQESKGKVFHHKAQAKLDKLLKEKEEEVKTMQGE